MEIKKGIIPPLLSTVYLYSALTDIKAILNGEVLETTMIRTHAHMWYAFSTLREKYTDPNTEFSVIGLGGKEVRRFKYKWHNAHRKYIFVTSFVDQNYFPNY